MQEIKVASGYEELRINDSVSVFLNATDTGFIEKYFNAFEAADKLQTEYEERVKSAEGREIFDIAREIDAGIRESINAIFDTDLCTQLFGSMHVMAAADGLPLWANLLFAFLDLIDDTFIEQKKKTNPRLEKYTKRYQHR